MPEGYDLESVSSLMHRSAGIKMMPGLARHPCLDIFLSYATDQYFDAVIDLKALFIYISCWELSYYAQASSTEANVSGKILRLEKELMERKEALLHREEQVRTHTREG